MPDAWSRGAAVASRVDLTLSSGAVCVGEEGEVIGGSADALVCCFPGLPRVSMRTDQVDGR